MPTEHRPSEIGHILGHRNDLKIFKKIEIMKSVLETKSQSRKMKCKLATGDGRTADAKGKMGSEAHFPAAEEAQSHLPGGNPDASLPVATPRRGRENELASPRLH